MVLSSLSPQQQEETDQLYAEDMNKIMRQRGFERFSAECYFFDEIGNGIDELLVANDEDELSDDIELDLVQEEDDDDEMDELQQIEEFLAGGHHPEQSWDYSLT
jgi:hypothetical protein